MTRFVILSTQRSGSTWAVDMLDSHPEVACYGELLLPEATGRHRAGSTDLPPLAEVLRARRHEPGRLARHVHGWRYLDDLHRRDRARAVGFKLMYAQVRPHPWVLPYLLVRRVRIVHFVRTNKLNQVLSRLFARATNQYHLRPGETVAQTRITVDPGEVLAEIAREERKAAAARRMVASLPVPSLEVSYEELLADPGRFDRLAGWLGIGPAKGLTTQLGRISGSGYLDRIENRDELLRALAQSPYAGTFATVGSRRK